MAFRSVQDPQLSPDGTQVAYVLSDVDIERDEYRSTIWVVPTIGGESRQLTYGPRRDSAPRWAPDGTSLAFLSDRASDKPQLYALPLGGGDPRALTSLDEGAGTASWSPDSRKIAFSARVLVERPPSDQEARKRWDLRPRVVTRAQYRADGMGYTFDARWHLFVIDTNGGDALRVTSGDSDDRGEAWSPDGRQLAFSRTRGRPGDYSVSDLHLLDLASGATRRVTAEIPRAVSPAWSPDGARLACYGDDSDDLEIGDPMTRVWVVSVEGRAPQRVTTAEDLAVVTQSPPAATPSPIWSSDARSLTFLASRRGSAHIVRVDTVSGEATTIIGGERQVASFTVVPDKVISFVAGDLERPADVYVADTAGRRERRCTDANGQLLRQLAIPRAERRTFKTPHGEVDGWLIRAVGATGASPLLVDIHGGPGAFAGNIIQVGQLYRYILAKRGWSVLMLNPTGSGSYGRAYAHGIRGQWGEHDLVEQLAAVDALIAEGVADARRLAVTGYSYGGFMTSWVIGHSDRFRAAVVGAPVVDQRSFHGTSDIGPWFTRWSMRGDPNTSREAFDRLSPINYVARVRTPTLLLHGEADQRCPIGQSEQFFMGLMFAGTTPVEFVRYPGSSHLLLRTGRPSHRVDFNDRLIDWVTRYVSAESS